MQPCGLAEEHRASLLRVVADGQHVIEILSRELIHILRAVGRNVGADLLHDRYRLGADGRLAERLIRAKHPRPAPKSQQRLTLHLSIGFVLKSAATASAI